MKAKKQPLHELLLVQNYSELQTCLQNSEVNLNEQDEFLRTPFMIAVKLGLAPIEVIERLITKVNYNTADASHATPMMFACAMRRIDVAKLILSYHALSLGLGKIDPNSLTHEQLKSLRGFVNQTHSETGKSLGFFALLRHGVAEDLENKDTNHLTVMNILRTVAVDGLKIHKANFSYACIIMQHSLAMLQFLCRCGLNLAHKQRNSKTIQTYLEGLKLQDNERYLTLEDKQYLFPIIEELANLDPTKLKAQIKTTGFFKVGDKDFSLETDSNVIGRAIGGLRVATINAQDAVGYNGKSGLMIYQNESCYVNPQDKTDNIPDFVTTIDLNQCVLIHFYNSAGDNYLLHLSEHLVMDIDAIRKQFKNPKQVVVAIYGATLDNNGLATLTTCMLQLNQYWQRNQSLQLTIEKQCILKYAIYPNHPKNIDQYDYEQATIWLQTRFAEFRKTFGLATLTGINYNFANPKENFSASCAKNALDKLDNVVSMLFEPLNEINPARDVLFRNKNFIATCERIVFTIEGFEKYIRVYKNAYSTVMPKVPRLSRCGIKLSTNELFIMGIANDPEQFCLFQSRIFDGDQGLKIHQVYSSADSTICREKPSEKFLDRLRKYADLFKKFRAAVAQEFPNDLDSLSIPDLIKEAGRGPARNQKAVTTHMPLIKALYVEMHIPGQEPHHFFRLMKVYEMLEHKPELFQANSASNIPI